MSTLSIVTLHKGVKTESFLTDDSLPQDILSEEHSEDESLCSLWK